MFKTLVWMRVAVLAVGLALAWPISAQADFMWMGEWNIALVGVAVGPGSTAKPNFGNVMVDLANASGTAATISDPTMASTADVTVSFMRQFKLFNDPEDSDVTLFGILSGALNSTSAAPKVFASASTLVDADIVGGFPIIITGAASVVAENDTDNEFLMTPVADSAILADGIYTVDGTLEVMVGASQSPVGLADANANVNWIVGVSAVPIPEPSTFLQLCLGVFLLFFASLFQSSRSSSSR